MTFDDLNNLAAFFVDRLQGDCEGRCACSKFCCEGSTCQSAVALTILENFPEIIDHKDNTPLLFSERLKLKEKYQAWCKEVPVSESADTLLMYLTLTNLLDAPACRKFLEKIKYLQTRKRLPDHGSPFHKDRSLQ